MQRRPNRPFVDPRMLHEFVPGGGVIERLIIGAILLAELVGFIATTLWLVSQPRG
jgi:hypothetical protein